MVWLKVAIHPVDVSELIDNGLETLCIKCDLQETSEDSSDTKEIICDIPNIENFAVITHLHLNHCHLEEFPNSLEIFTNLRVFNVSFNCFKKVPECLETNMAELEKIDLSCNRIETFDFVPACVRSLKDFNISNNAIQFFPKWLNKAINLVKIDIENNPLSKESQALENIITNVKILNISNCRFDIDDLHLLQNFPNLENLNIGTKYSIERIPILPVDILQKVPKLQTLHITHSELFDINDISILDNLTVINFEANQLKYLPDDFVLLKNLKDCKLSSNMIKTLPKNFSQLRSLQKLHLDRNLLTKLPESLSELPSLNLLDVYNNLLTEVPMFYKNLVYFDIARNDVDEPDSEIYSKMKNALRQLYNYHLRRNSRLSENELEVFKDNWSDESELSSLSEEITEPLEIVEENWDSDNEWEPGRNEVWDCSCYDSTKQSSEKQLSFVAVPGQFDD